MIDRKIIDVDNTTPFISAKKKRQRLIAILSLILVTALISLILINKTSHQIQKIGNYTIATVVKDSLTTSTEASGSVVLPTQVSIVTMDEGYASILNVKAGDRVTKETVLAELDVPELDQIRVDLENSIESNLITLEQIVLNNEFTIKELNNQIKRINEDILDAQQEVETQKSLMQLKSSRESDYNSAVDILVDLNNDLEDLELSLEREIKLGALNKKAQETLIKQSKINLSRTNSDIEESKIRSPIEGDVLYINEKLSVPGSLITQNLEIFTVANTENVYIDLEVYEQYRTALNVGDTVELLISSRIIKAEVEQVGSVATLSSDSLAATVTVRVKPLGDVELTMGASAVADIPLGTKQDALLLPRGSYLTTGNQQYLYVIKNDIAIKTPVTYGSMHGNQVEILSGVQEGDRVIISSYQNFITQEQISLEEK